MHPVLKLKSQSARNDDDVRGEKGGLSVCPFAIRMLDLLDITPVNRLILNTKIGQKRVRATG